MIRNKQQSDIMYNMITEFAIHGVTTGQVFYKELVALLDKYGDAVRLVGFNTKKPTARVDCSVLFKDLYISIANVSNDKDADKDNNQESLSMSNDQNIDDQDTEEEDISDDTQSNSSDRS